MTFIHKNDYNIIEIPAIMENNSRYYISPEGKYPSVTTVTGWKKSQFFKQWRKNNPRESRRVLKRGNDLHEAIEQFLLEKDNFLENKENIKDLFFQIKDYLVNHIDIIHALEVPLWSSLLKLAGRVDCVANYKGKLSIIDFKGSTNPKKESEIENYFLQATAYAIMWQERTGIPIEQIVILISSEEGIVQEFIKEPQNYVKALKGTIEEYWRGHI
jgi:genome maintenance exonuclease 1